MEKAKSILFYFEKKSFPFTLNEPLKLSELKEKAFRLLELKCQIDQVKLVYKGKFL